MDGGAGHGLPHHAGRRWLAPYQSAQLEEASITLVERVAEWPKQWLRERREQGVAEGRSQGVAEGPEQGLTQSMTSNGHCCVGRRLRATMPTPMRAWPTCWHRSPIRNGWPRSVTGWCAATPPPRSSPTSIPPHPLRPAAIDQSPETSSRRANQTFAIPQSRLARANRKDALMLVAAAPDHERSLDLIWRETARGGRVP